MWFRQLLGLTLLSVERLLKSFACEDAIGGVYLALEGRLAKVLYLGWTVNIIFSFKLTENERFKYGQNISSTYQVYYDTFVAIETRSRNR